MLTFATQLARPKHRFVAWIAALAALGGFLFGFDTGVVGSAEPYFSKSLGIGSFGESWVVGSLLLGAVAGAALAGYLADALSRSAPRPWPCAPWSTGRSTSWSPTSS